MFAVRRAVLRLHSSGMLLRMDWRIGTDVSENLATSILRVVQWTEILTLILLLENVIEQKNMRLLCGSGRKR
jgi:hypothetical protein